LPAAFRGWRSYRQAKLALFKQTLFSLTILACCKIEHLPEKH